MKRVALGSRVREIDAAAINERNIEGLTLMERAGTALAQEILTVLEEVCGKNCVILCGSGNNGGDGYVAARLLTEAEKNVQVFSVVNPENLRGDAKTSYYRYAFNGGNVEVLEKSDCLERMEEACAGADVIVDALLGTGISREVTGLVKRVIEIINHSGKDTISVDIPSGVGADDGKIYGVSVKAKKTVTFQMNKLGMCIRPGKIRAGTVVVADIGLPEDLCREEKGVVYLAGRSDAAELLPRREHHMNKGDAGKLLLVAGSKGMAGAAVLAARGAYRSGAGLVKVAAPWEAVQIIQAEIPEAVCLILEENGNTNCKLISKEAESCDAVVVGPGLGRSEAAGVLVEHIIKNIDKPLLLDADGINLISENPGLLKQAKGEIVMTPHPGEMGRLIKAAPAAVNQNRVGIAQSFASEYNVTLVLKGAGTVIACPDGATFVNPTGNSGMATAGSGDVLSGITGAFLAAGLSVKDSAVLGTYVHGMSGDICLRTLGEYGMMASDLAGNAGKALKYLTRMK